MSLSQATGFALLISIVGFPLVYFIEAIGSQFFVKAFYNFGFIILTKEMEIDSRKMSDLIGKIIKKRTGKFKFTSSNEVLFTPRWYVFNASARSIFPIRATANTTIQNQLNIKGKVPIGSTLFLISYTFGWILCNFLLVVFDGDKFNIKTLVPVLIGVVLGYMSYLTEKRRFKFMVNELQEIINATEVSLGYKP